MNKVFVCFTCERDLMLLQLHCDAIHKAIPNAKVYYVFEDDEEGKVDAPLNGIKVFATFKHNGNLIGKDCHTGMLDTMRTISEANNNANIIKIDSDVIFINDEWLNTLGNVYDMVGTATMNGYYCKGTCYGMTHDLICKVLDYCGNDYIDLYGRIEDGTITMISAIVSEPNKVKILNTVNEDASVVYACAFRHEFYSTPEAIKNISGFIDCGDSTYTKYYIDSNLPVHCAKHRAMSFVMNNLGE